MSAERPEPLMNRLPEPTPPTVGEVSSAVARIGNVTIEAITSSADPRHAAQVQDHDEWVVVLAGAATFEIDGSVLDLRPGSWVLIPAGAHHQVVRTAAGTRWLALHATGD